MGLKATALLGGGGSLATLTNVPTWLPIGGFVFDYTDFAVAATSTDILLYSLPAGAHVTGAKLKHGTLFTGPGIVTVEASVGRVGALEQIIPLSDVLQAVGPTVLVPVDTNQCLNQDAATALRVQLVSTGANLNVLTQGEFQIWLELSKAV